MTDSRHLASGSDDAADTTDLNELPATIAGIVESMGRGKIARLVLTKGDFHLELEAFDAPASRIHETGTARPEDHSEERAATAAPTHVITSPMIGTFYAAPAPGEPPFISVGDSVAQGDTVGIVEAMKIMNEIAADRSGSVVSIVATNGETVEYGSPLIELDPND